MRGVVLKVLFMALTSVTLAVSAGAQMIPSAAKVANSQQEELLANVGWSPKLHQKLPLDLKFTDDQGQVVQLGDYFGKKPVILTLMYLECPMLCGEVINGTFQGLQDLKFKAGRDFQYVAVSINPKEKPPLAAAKKGVFLKKYGLKAQANGFHFLTGQAESIDRLAKSVGFRYAYDPKTQSYAHPAGIILVTPDGQISRYMGGVIFHPQDLRLGLVDSSQGKVGSLADILLLKCCAFDPNTGKYNLAVHRLLQGGGLLTLLCLGLLIFTLTRRHGEHAGNEEERK